MSAVADRRSRWMKDQAKGEVQAAHLRLIANRQRRLGVDSS